MLPSGSDGAGADQHILGFAAVRARIHAQRATDGARDAAIKSEACDAGVGCCARDFHVRHDGAHTEPMALFHSDACEAAAQADNDTFDAAVAHEQVRTEPDDEDRQRFRLVLQEVGKVRFVGRHEQDLRGAASAEPRDVGERGVGRQAAAQLGHAGFEVIRDVGEGHRRTLYSGAGAARLGGGQPFGKVVSPLRGIARAEHDHHVAWPAMAADEADELARFIDRRDRAVSRGADTFRQ